MTDRTAAVHRIFLLAAEHPVAGRDAILRAQCGDDLALRAEVEELLAHDTDDSFFAEPQLAEVRQSLRDDQLPERIGSFQPLAVLGRGGMGVVYRARQDQPAREVALKVLAPGLGSHEARTRFALEAEALGRLQHPGIAQVFEAGMHQWQRERNMRDPHEQNRVQRNLPILRSQIWPSVPFKMALASED